MTKREIYNPDNYFIGIDDIVSVAVERVKEAYTFSQNLGLEKLYVCFSGGKDSIAVYGICRHAFGETLLDKCDFEYNHTGIDYPEVVRFIRDKYPFVHSNMPHLTMWELLLKYKMPPTPFVRFCCRELKEHGGKGRFCVTGIRWQESSSRKHNRGIFEKDRIILNNDNDESRRQLEHCVPKNKFVCNPIIDWNEEEVWRFIVKENLDYPSLYDEGFRRVGCIGCPLKNKRDRLKDFERYPKYKEQYMRMFERIIDKRKAEGLTVHQQTAQELWDWWFNE